MAQPPASPAWVVQESGTTASLRGISAVNAKVAWASGSGGTYLRTIDGGATWKAAKVPGASDVDFRAVRAFDDKTAFLLSIGNGEKSRIYRTSDAGERWQLLYTNPDPKGFWDALAFWDDAHGIILGDPVDGHFVVMTTEDGGQSWRRKKTPAALPNEGAFAASNSCLIVFGPHQVWFGTGGPGGARVFHSEDGGVTWTVAKTPIRNDGASAGIFSLAFSDARHGIAVGGDYNKPAETTSVVALTSDGGKTWTAPSGAPPSGFRSVVGYHAELKVWIAAGTSGSDVSLDSGNSWRPLNSDSYNAISIAPFQATWAVGPKGAIAELRFRILQ
jgi:photosystem II stability/assembly factor-like uncharacterized protein